MAQRLVLEQKQILTQHLIQTMEILQMSAMELSAYLENLSMENPVVELEDLPDEWSSESRDMLRARKLEWLESTDHQNKVYYKDDTKDNDTYWSDVRDTGETLTDYLLAQIMTSSYSNKEREIIEFLILSLDATGYLTDNTAEIAALLSVEENQVLHMLKELQSLDPAGVGARDLAECLLLQLKRDPAHSELAEAIVRDHLWDIGRQHLSIVAKKLNVSVEKIREACEQIRALNPKPGNSFSDRSELYYISPDAVVVRVEDGFEILVNEYQYPRFHISTYYQDLARTVTDEETKKYLREKIRQAKTVEANIQQRASTLSKVLHALVEKQQEFFLKGVGNRRPMKLSDLATSTGLHESTISRALRSKYLQCMWGVYPLNYFLTSTASTNAESGEAQTPEFIKSKIKAVIDSENKQKPLSDEAISKALQEQQIRISRRTVNKYRQEMQVPDKSGRKQ